MRRLYYSTFLDARFLDVNCNGLSDAALTALLQPMLDTLGAKSGEAADADEAGGDATGHRSYS